MGVRSLLRGAPWGMYVLLVLAPVAAVVHVAAPSLLERVAQEDGPIEYLQALAMLGGAILFFAVARRRRGRDAWALLFGVGLLLVAGEEISWGQRLFGISTPEGLESRNVQGEFNLHNVEGIHQNVRALGMMVIVTLFIIVPLARAASARLAAFEARLRVPEVPL